MSGNFKTVQESQTTITELMIPSYSNFGGKVHGGLILSLMDKVAYVCAAKHSGGYCVTASMNAVDFLAPVKVGDLVHLHGSVNYVDKSSLVIGIKVISEDVNTGISTHTNSSYLTMVALDENRNKRSVPGLTLESDQEVLRFMQAKIRIALINEYKQSIHRSFLEHDLQDAVSVLKNDKCQILKK